MFDAEAQVPGSQCLIAYGPHECPPGHRGTINSPYEGRLQHWRGPYPACKEIIARLLATLERYAEKRDARKRKRDAEEVPAAVKGERATNTWPADVVPGQVYHFAHMNGRGGTPGTDLNTSMVVEDGQHAYEEQRHDHCTTNTQTRTGEQVLKVKHT